MPSDISCKTCEIVLEHVATLGDTIGPGMIGREPPVLARDGRGRFYMAQTRAGEVVVFDPQGRFLRTIGTEGSGPGEYSSGYKPVIATNGDSIHVFDVPNARHTVLSPDYAVTRSVPLSTQMDPLGRWMESARWVVPVDAHTPADLGWRLRVVDDSGKAIRRLGEASPLDPRKQILVRAVSRVANSRIWTGGGGRYLVELWDSTGHRQRAFSRDVDWFPAIDVTDPKWLTQYWPGTVVALQEDAEGRLWVVIVVAEAPADASPPGNPNVPPAKRTGVIEVIDIKTGRLLATKRLPSVPDRFLGGSILSTYREDERTGQPYVDVWRLRLEK